MIFLGGISFTMKTILNHIVRLKYLLCLLAFFSILTTFFSIAANQYLGNLTSYVTTSGLRGSFQLVIETLVLYMIFYLFYQFVYKGCVTRIDITTYQSLSEKLARKMMHLPILDHYLQHSDDTYTLLSSDVGTVQETMSEIVPEIIYQTFRLGLTLIYIGIANIPILIGYLMAVITSLVIQILIGKLVQKASVDSKQSEIALHDAINDSLDNRLIIKTYQAQDYNDNHLNQKISDFQEKQVHMERVAMPVKIFGLFLGLFPILVVCILGIYFLSHDMIVSNTFFTIYYLCSAIVVDQMHYTDTVTSYFENKPSMMRIADFLNHEIAEPDMHYGDVLQLENVTYTYPETSSPALKDINIVIHKSEKVGITGESGSGKSTLIKLLAGYDSPQTGSITTMQCAYTQQFPYIFEDTLQNNLTCWNSSISQEEIQKVIQDCKLEDVVSSLPQGLNTVLKSNGSNLSGGQKQRIAVARTLLSHQNLMFFDESLSGCDALTATEVLSNIVKHYPEKTILFA